MCTGALVLGAAGVLARQARDHPLDRDRELARLGADAVPSAWSRTGKIVTAAGVSSGIDMALRSPPASRARTEPQAIQLAIEYDPQPPFDAGSPRTAPGHLVEHQRAHSRFNT